MDTEIEPVAPVAPPPSPADLKINFDFTYRTPNPEQLSGHQTISETARNLARVFVGHCPQGRELSLAMANLEQAVLWANAAISKNEL